MHLGCLLHCCASQRVSHCVCQSKMENAKIKHDYLGVVGRVFATTTTIATTTNCFVTKKECQRGLVISIRYNNKSINKRNHKRQQRNNNNNTKCYTSSSQGHFRKLFAHLPNQAGGETYYNSLSIYKKKNTMLYRAVAERKVVQLRERLSYNK